MQCKVDASHNIKAFVEITFLEGFHHQKVKEHLEGLRQLKARIYEDLLKLKDDVG